AFAHRTSLLRNSESEKSTNWPRSLGNIDVLLHGRVTGIRKRLECQRIVRHWIRIPVGDLCIALNIKRKYRPFVLGISELPLITGRDFLNVLPGSPDWRVLKSYYARWFIDSGLDLNAFARINTEIVIA
ncbi:MAG TPA: hypothetical protein VIK39_13070, partial [Candidatus Angelobacter sp.]